jgi:hypothetical protein
VDFFAVYLVPIDLWYIIPFEVAEGNASLNLTPRAGHKFAQYMELEFAERVTGRAGAENSHDLECE